MSNNSNLDSVKFSLGGVCENEPASGIDAATATASNNNNNDDDIDPDHRPHQLFCEMDELQSNFEWKEAARWLKFEEDVEGGGRWSKPHVATLSLHSLFELRSCLLNGATLLDFAGEDLPGIVDGMLDYVIRAKMLDENIREPLRNALLLKHVHQHEKEYHKLTSNGSGDKKSFHFVKSLADMGKKLSHIDLNNTPGASSAALKSNTPPTHQQTSSNLLATNASEPAFDLGGSMAKINKVDSKPKDFLSQISSNVSIASNISSMPLKMNQHFMRKIPAGAEASNVLVGEVDFLEYQFSAFIRLAKSVVLGDLTEVPVPTRFLFVILGPKGNIAKYHEIGRSISTLMSDEIFHDVAYKEKNKLEILNAFDVFLDQVTVLPPGEWDPNIRLDPPNKVPLKEERLERIAETAKQTNGSTGSNNGNIHKKGDGEHELHNEHEEDPGLKFTGRFCGGLIDDIKRKAPWYLSDFRDGLNFQCLSSVMFMYFACLAPIITFGGLLGNATDDNMSAIESLLSGAVCGILYSLFAGQPLTIMGSTGPVLVFETILNNFSKHNGIDYMGFRACIGLWTALLLFIIVITDCSALVKFITRFTEESFAALIAFIFIHESIMKVLDIRKTKKFSNDPFNYKQEYASNQECMSCVYRVSENQTNYVGNFSGLNETECKRLGAGFEFARTCKYTPDVFFFSVVLYAFTFLMAMSLRQFRTSRFFPSFVRSKVADFGVVITIASAVALDFFMGFDTPKLNVPIKFQTTIPSRGWFINPIERNKDKLWLIVVAIIPALLATILIFMDQHITAVIMNRKENKLKKGSGYHLDLLIVSITIAINSMLGIPWFVAATVLSINHVISIKKESESAAPGEKPKFLGCIEQRVTGTVVFMLIGSSVFLATFLRRIPMPVLYGIFLYMGISSLNGIQFMQRLILILMPEKHQPDFIFLRHVRTMKVHLFTFIQIACLAMLLIIKQNKTISILFPIMVLGLVGIRKLMDFGIFTQRDLSYLDDIMPEFVKRSKEDGTHSEDIEEDIDGETKPEKAIGQVDSFVLSQELNKTHIWQDLVNSDRQLAMEREKKYSKSSQNKSLKKRKTTNNNGPTIDEDLNMPLIVTTVNTPTNTQSPTQPPHQPPSVPTIPKIVVGNMKDENSKL